MNVDEHGNHVNPGQIEITDHDLVLYQRGKSPIKWPLRTLRRYGFDAEHFSFESGRRCQTGPGIYAFRCRRAEQLFNLLQSRIQTRNNGENDPSDNSIILGTSNRDTMYLEPTSLRRNTPGSRFSSQNGMTRLSSVGSASGSVGPLSPQSIATPPLDTIPLIPPLPVNRPLSQNLYANEDIIASVTQDFEETNNNKTVDEPTFPPTEHTYLNASVLESLPTDEQNNLAKNIQHICLEESSSSNLDSNHLYMNIIPGTDKIAPRFPVVQAQPSVNFVTLKWNDSEESMSTYANLEAEVNLSKASTEEDLVGMKCLNYIVLDLEPSGDPPKSPTASQPPDNPRKLSGGYAAIDFKKTVALSHSVNPNFYTDSESSRKTRHSSNVNNMFTHERHSSWVSD